MVDRETGRLVLGDGIEIAPSLSRQAFERSAMGRAARLNIGTLSYNLPSGSLQGRRVLATVYFEAQRLTSVDIVLSAEPKGTSWEDWSLEKEMAAKAFHEAVLKEELGEPHEINTGIGSPMGTEQERYRHTRVIYRYLGECARDGLGFAERYRHTRVTYRYPWGEVMSIYDERASFSFIFVRYQ